MSSQDAKYQLVMDWVKENIANGTFRDGDRLMSEKELGEKFSLSRQTIRHATGELEKEHIVTRVRGSGTYIGAGRASGVRKEKYFNIAVVSTFYESYIFPQILKGIESVLSGHGYVMQVYFTDNRLQRERDILQSVLEKDNIDGMIVEPAESALPNPNMSCYRQLQERDIPILFFNAFYRDLDAPCVRLDDRKIACKATELLTKAGHRQLAGIFKSDDGQGLLRYEGFIQAAAAGGCRINQEHIVWVDTPLALHLGEIENYLFKRIDGCSGIVCYNDQVASQLIEMALSRGIRIPEDLSVVGIDDSYLASAGKVPFTSFPHPKEELGRMAGTNIIKMIEDPSFDGNYLFDSEPVDRGSIRQV